MFVCGIDFGTTNSVAAVARPGEGSAAVVAQEPSCILIVDESAGHRLYVGQEAVDRYLHVTAPARFVKSMKSVLPDLSFTTTNIFGRHYGPEHLARPVLSRLKEQIEARTGQPMQAVTIGRPVRFSEDPQADAEAERRLEKAAHLAGFQRVEFRVIRRSQAGNITGPRIVMTSKRTTLEIIAPSVEEAVQKGLNELGIPEDAVEIEVLDEGSRGFLKLGSRDARIRLTVKDLESDAVARPKRKAEPLPKSELETVEPQELDEQLIMAKTTVEDLLERMKIFATVNTHYGEPENPGDEKPVVVDIRGNDLSILIGRKAETLNALQYITNLIIGRHLEKWVPLHIDVEGYRARRELALKNLASVWQSKPVPAVDVRSLNRCLPMNAA